MHPSRFISLLMAALATALSGYLLAQEVVPSEPIPHAENEALQPPPNAPVITPTEVIRDQFHGQLPASAPFGAPFTLYRIVVRDQHSSLSIRLRGKDGDADLLLAEGEPIRSPDDAVLISSGPESSETIRLGRETLPTLRTTDYFLYVFRTTEGEQALDLSVHLNLPSDEGLEEVPSLPKGIRLPTEDELQQDRNVEAVITTTTQVRLAVPSGAPLGPRTLSIEIPAVTRGLDVYLLGNQSDIDLVLQGPLVEGADSRLEFESSNPLSSEEISVRSHSDDPLPAGQWTLTLLRRDQLPAEPLLLRVDIMEDLTAGARDLIEHAEHNSEAIAEPEPEPESNSDPLPSSDPDQNQNQDQAEDPQMRLLLL